MGDRDAAGRVIEFLAGRLPGHVPPVQHAHLARGRGLIALNDGDDETAERELAAAISGFGEIECRYWQAVSEADLAAVLAGQGRGEEAAGLLERAIGVLEPIGARPALARARQLVAQTTAPVRPACPVAQPDRPVPAAG